MNQDAQPLDAEELASFFARIDHLASEDVLWVRQLFDECMRARAREMKLMESNTEGGVSEAQFAQVALDAAEWLRTLWNVGYMGSGSLPSQPRTAFPVVEMEDVLKSSLFARIRGGKRPLPFPPPTRNGLPWHDLIEGAPKSYVVNAEMIHDENGIMIGAIIEGCTDWVVIEDVGNGFEYTVQYRGKGPLFRLNVNPFFSNLQRLPPQWERQIRVQEHADVKSYILIWTLERGGATKEIPIPANTWEHAESEAAYWVAKNHPEMYGRVRFKQQLSAG